MLNFTTGFGPAFWAAFKQRNWPAILILVLLLIGYVCFDQFIDSNEKVITRTDKWAEEKQILIRGNQRREDSIVNSHVARYDALMNLILMQKDDLNQQLDSRITQISEADNRVKRLTRRLNVETAKTNAVTGEVVKKIDSVIQNPK